MSITSQLKRDIIQWDVSSWSSALDFWEARVDWSRVETCLELGAREGGLSLWLALKGKAVVCSNNLYSRQFAEPLHQRYELGSRIKYEDIDARDIPHIGQFDLIVFKSVLGAIGEGNKEAQRQVVAEIHKALRPKGMMLFAENLCASSVHSYFRRKFTRWSSYWTYPSLAETETFLEGFTSYQLQTTGVLGTFGRTERQRSLLSRVDKVLLNRITPPSWRYIVYGLAEK